ncbi:MAG: hypothetical protein KKD38_00065, partial [Candidatus Delongbacteria bacterium]|nr:hypothetical protein [Candidatus Delongbacteria bacterium]
IGICVIAGFIYAVGGLESYLFYFGDIINELVSVKDPTKIHPQNHSFIKLFQSYNTDFINVILGLFKNVFIIILIEFFISKTKNLKPIKYLVIIIGAFTLYYFIFDINDYNHYTNNVIMYILSFFISIYVLWTFFTENAIIRKYILLITASIGMFFFSFIGSDLIFRAAFHVNSELILFTLPVILIRESEFKLLNIKVKFTFLFYFILIIFSLQIIYKKDNLYREPNFKFISETFDTPSLAGIKSNPQRVDVIDSLLTYLSTIQDFKEKKVMFTHSNVLMYYLTGANYILSSPWDILNDYYSLKQNLALNKPDYFIVPKESHRIHTWPLKSETDSAESRAKKYYDIYDSFIKGNNYIEIYKNSFYTVYGSNDENKAENK